MIVKYTNSANKTISFAAAIDPNKQKVKISGGTLHTRTWKPSITANRVGGRVDYFSAEPAQIALTITTRGSAKERKQQLNDMFDVFETDIANNSPGTFYYGDWYCECFITESTSKAGDLPTWIEQDVTLYIPSAKWYTEQTVSIRPVSTTASKATVKYPTPYPFTYPIVQNSTVNVENDHFTACDFLMRCYGPATEIDVTINGNKYKVNQSLETGEILTIDSRSSKSASERIYLTKVDGTKVNCYNKRDSDCDIFAEIPAGPVSISYNRTYGIDLTIFKGRREPKWQ